MSFWKPFSTEGKDSQSRLELNFESGLMISVKGKMLLGAENVFLEVIGDQEERDEEQETRKMAEGEGEWESGSWTTAESSKTNVWY